MKINLLGNTIKMEIKNSMEKYANKDCKESVACENRGK
jgi:hypothetical protein